MLNVTQTLKNQPYDFVDLEKMLKSECLVARIGADPAETGPNVADVLLIF